MCDHPSSLIYFDKSYGQTCQWEVCEVCGVEFNVLYPKGPEAQLEAERDQAWLDAYRFNGTKETV